MISRTITKVCTGCEIAKPLDAYANQIGGRYGKRARCRQCISAQYKNKRSSDLEWRARENAKGLARLHAKKTDPDWLAREVSTEGTKECIDCREFKDVLQFNLANDKLDGRAPYCKSCIAKHHQRRRENRTPEQISEERAKSRERQRIKRQNPEFRASENAKNRIRVADYYDERKADPNWIADRNAKIRTRRRSDPVFAERTRQAARGIQARRRARKTNNPVDSNAKTAKTLHKEQKGICGYVNLGFTRCLSLGKDGSKKRIRFGSKWHKDHIMPVERGGGETNGNLIGACAPCNQSKSNKTPREFGKWIRERRLVHPKISVQILPLGKRGMIRPARAKHTPNS